MRGVSTSIEIYSCTPEIIRDPEAILRFVTELCEFIEMKRFGEMLAVHFGQDERVAGMRMVQFIETSLISAHFANLTNTTYLDIFSCRPYNAEIAAEFARKFFGGNRVNFKVTLRH